MKPFMLLGLVALLFLLPGISSCEEKVAESNGMVLKQGPDGKWYTEVDPKGGTVGKVTQVVQDGTSGTPLAPIGLATSALVNLLQVILKRRMDAEAEARNKALNATATGLQNAVKILPPEHAKDLVKAIDMAHDAAGVDGKLQDMLQPLMTH